MNDTKKAKLSISYSFDEILECFGLLKPLNYKPTHMHVYIYRERAGDMHTDMYVFDYYKHLCISMYTYVYRERDRERGRYIVSFRLLTV